jgi:mannose/cellobiose epimerase-like protein (N-acyl-D-glucosamine 2-epimerase family)
MTHHSLKLRLQAARTWAFDHALPFWLERGVDRAVGGFVEALTFTREDAALPYKRVRVTGRQIYVFSHAATLGWRDGLAAAESGARFLTQYAWTERGFVRRLSRDGQVIDPVIDLYDNAFCLFGFAWLYKATGDQWALEWAKRTVHAVKAGLTHPSGGYWHDDTRQGHRQQNPHMHWIEASLVAAEASGESLFFEEAHAVATLFETKFFDGETLAEFFADDFSRAAGDDGRIIEPGHMMEWSWILAAYGRLSSQDLSGAIGRLIDRAESMGVDAASGAVRNAVRDDGVVLDGGSRTWPNTERLKAAVAAAEILGRRGAAAMAEGALGVLLDRYLATPVTGGWYDSFNADGQMSAPNMPASTLYHVFLAFAEALRAEEALLA